MNQTIQNEMPEGLSSHLAGGDLLNILSVQPPYDPEICTADAGTRLDALQDIYDIYIPTSMTAEIYRKLYVGLQSSLRKKCGIGAVRQRNLNYRTVRGGRYNGTIGGADSFTIVGQSGIGKSAAIGHAREYLNSRNWPSGGELIRNVIPCLEVQCPFDSSPKALLLEILRTIDIHLDSSYYNNALRSRATQDMLIGMVSQACLNHVGILIIDEIQNVVGSRNGRNLVGMLTQMINAASGVSLCMVGTPESSLFFEEAMHLARRTIGLQYGPLEYGETFRRCCEVLWQYQYVRHRTELTPSFMEWLFEYSNGIMAVLVSLFHDVQEMAIMNGSERITLQGINQTYRSRMGMLQMHLSVPGNAVRASGKKAKVVPMVKQGEPVGREPTAVPEGERLCNPVRGGKEPAVEEGHYMLLSDLNEQARLAKKDIADVLAENAVLAEVITV